MSYTKGRLVADGDWIGLEGKLRGDPVATVAYIDSTEDVEINVANARRLVACWNALDGISTDAIESYPLSVNGMVHVGIIKQERDELLAALRGLHTQVLMEFCYCPDPVKFDAILAKYKEAE